MISSVFVQKLDGEFVSPNSYAAWGGFTDRGVETNFYEWPALRDGLLLIGPETLVVGGAGAVRYALSGLGVQSPTIDDLPEILSEFRGRNVWQSSLGDVRALYNEQGPSVFVKPLRDPKAFPARVISAFHDIIPSAHLPDEMPVLVSEPVDFISEWRFFVLHQKVVGAGWYSGEPLRFPDCDVVEAAVRVWGANAPAGYGIDFGVIADGRTVLVEVNEGYSLGCLGLRPILYSQILEARWNELMAARKPIRNCNG